MAILAFDTATSRFHTDKASKEEPQTIRLAWWRDDSEPVCRIIRPAVGLTIDKATTAYHGLTLDDVLAGVDAKRVIAELEAAAHGARVLASYNSDFHWRALYRLMNAPAAKPPSTAVDVMALATPILAIPLMRPGGGFKSASLREACRHFDLPEPATMEAGPVEIALSTVRAVMSVYKACVAQDSIQQAARS